MLRIAFYLKPTKDLPFEGLVYKAKIFHWIVEIKFLG